MGIGDLWQMIALVVLLALSAFFSASETALMTLSKIRIRNMVDEKVPKAQLIQKLIENPGKLLGAILVGNNVVNIAASALATSLAIKHFGDTGVGIATGIMTFLVLVFSEITPKSLAAQNSEKVSLRVVRLLSVFVAALHPVTTIMMRITNGIIKLFGGKTSERQSFVTEEEIRTMINMGHEDGALESEEKKMIHNVFEFGDLKVSDVMTPRVDMIAVDVHSSYDETINRFDVHRFSRLPVYEGRVDNIIGVLYMKDLVFLNADSETFNITKHMREPYFTYEYKQVTQLFHSMREHRIPMAIVIDEYGGTAGVVTLEDLVEEIVGDILDEYDEQEKEIEKIQENEYLVDGVTDIDTVNETLGVNIESEYFDSIGGFVTGLFGRLPEKGEQIEYNSITFIVDSKERNRIGKLRILAKG